MPVITTTYPYMGKRTEKMSADVELSLSISSVNEEVQNKCEEFSNPETRLEALEDWLMEVYGMNIHQMNQYLASGGYIIH